MNPLFSRKSSYWVLHFLFALAYFSCFSQPNQQVVLHRFPYTFELNVADKAIYDQATGVWIQQVSASETLPTYLSFTYTLKNSIETQPGKIVAELGSINMIPDPYESDIVKPVPAGQNITGTFRSAVPKPGNYTIRFKYVIQGSRFNALLRRMITFDSVVQESTFDYQFNIVAVDKDADGIDDNVENRLIEKFRPYYKFTLSGGNPDEYRPLDAFWFMKHSSLVHYDNVFDPSNLNAKSGETLLTSDQITGQSGDIIKDGLWLNGHGSPNLVDNPVGSDYFLNPPEEIQNGAGWPQVRAEGNTGLYAHVVKLRLLDGSDRYDRTRIPSSDAPGKNIFYKIEYWQFYGFNEGHGGPATQHEGDWTTVQIIFNPLGGVNEDSIESVLYYEHGNLEIRFQMPSVQAANDHQMEPLTDHFVDYRGGNFGNGCRYPDHVDYCNDNTIIFAQDPVTQRFTHPVVFIENGGHEPWPTKEGYYSGATASHEGDDIEHSYLTSTAPNIGEVEFPADIPGVKELLQFNGSWGAKNGGARGPSLHKQWTWPETSSVRWRLKGATD